jgi:hypothetical protein
MSNPEDDGKVRVRCTGCGKRVKFPANVPGQTFRCPICKTTLVTPLDGESMGIPPAQDFQSATRTAVHRFRPHPAPETPRALADEGPAEPMGSPIQKITAFLIKETQRSTQLCEAILARAAMPLETQATQIRQLRQAKAYHFKQYVEAILKEVDGAIAALHNSPVVETDTGKARFQKMLAERRAVLLFLNIMYEFRPISERAASNGGAPGSAAERPTTTSTPAAQTPPRPAGGPPAPDDKAPGSNGSPTS